MGRPDFLLESRRWDVRDDRPAQRRGFQPRRRRQRIAFDQKLLAVMQHRQRNSAQRTVRHDYQSLHLCRLQGRLQRRDQPLVQLLCRSEIVARTAVFQCAAQHVHLLCQFGARHLDTDAPHTIVDAE